MGRLAVAAAVAAWAIPLAVLVDSVVPDPYMDEIFHVPQAQRYCRGEFLAWDPMITTPPGLYYISLAYLASLFPAAWAIKVAEAFDPLCTTALLRSTNVVMAMVCGVLVHDLLLCIKPGIGKTKATAYAILVALYPVHWFFTFLYYTDIASLAAVLAMYLFCLKKRFWVSAMFGAASILFRQTNVIWMIFFAANGAITYVQDLSPSDYVSHKNTGLRNESSTEGSDRDKIASAPGLRRRRTNSSISKREFASGSTKLYKSEYSSCFIEAFSYSISTFTAGFRPPLDSLDGMLNVVWQSELQLKLPSKIVDMESFTEEIWDISFKLWNSKCKVLITFTPFAIVLVVFVAFIIWNGGIVLGAKEAHVVSPHFAQFLYFGLVSAAALLPLHFTPGRVSELFRVCAKNKTFSSLAMLVALGLSFVAVHFFSIAHPYLLADNRHYTFYIWRKVIQAHWMMKYILIPLYVYSWFSVINILGKSQTMVWVLSFVFAVALVLVPAPLVEFRYYTIPLVIVFLNSPVIGNGGLLALGSAYAAADFLTLAMFLFKPFHWEHEPGTQRFMW